MIANSPQCPLRTAHKLANAARSLFLIRPIVIVSIERYNPQRKAEFPFHTKHRNYPEKSSSGKCRDT